MTARRMKRTLEWPSSILSWPGSPPASMACHSKMEAREEMRNQGSSATLIELALIIVLIAIVVMAILLIMGDDLRLWIVNTLQGLIPTR